MMAFPADVTSKSTDLQRVFLVKSNTFGGHITFPLS